MNKEMETKVFTQQQLKGVLKDNNNIARFNLHYKWKCYYYYFYFARFLQSISFALVKWFSCIIQMLIRHYKYALLTIEA
jgi:hypothetical protein